MVPAPVGSAIVAPAGLDSVTTKLSSPSMIVSPKTTTVIVLLVSPGWNVSVPEVAAKSLPPV